MKISIVVPVYNTEKYLDKCIQSLINQTYNNIEIILINDGSTDNSLSILKKYEKEDKRIKIIDQYNSGGVIARKVGVTNAIGEYCLIIDSDDWIELNTVKTLVTYVEKYNKPDIVKFRCISEPQKIEQKILFDNKRLPMLAQKKDIFNLLIYSGDFNNIWNCLVKRDLFDFNSFIFNRIVHKAEDLQINLQLFLKANSYLIVNDVLYHYYNNPIGITNNITKGKYINNIIDKCYLNELRIKIANQMYDNCNEVIIKENFLKDIIDMTIRLLKYEKLKKKDLLEIEAKLENNKIFIYLQDINLNDIKLGYLQKRICKHIVNKKMIKIYKYQFFYKFKRKIKKILYNR